MKRVLLLSAVSCLAVSTGACGGGEPTSRPDGSSGTTSPPTPTNAVPAPPTGAMETPEWFSVDHEARTAHIVITAGATTANNYWNMNGAIRGALAINVPEGYTISIDLINRDPNMPHSLVVSSEISNFAVPLPPEPVFPGAITEGATSMAEATQSGETETIRFVADRAGQYSLVCLIPGHSALGMWLWFIVTPDGGGGVQGL